MTMKKQKNKTEKQRNSIIANEQTYYHQVLPQCPLPILTLDEAIMMPELLDPHSITINQRHPAVCLAIIVDANSDTLLQVHCVTHTDDVFVQQFFTAGLQ